MREAVDLANRSPRDPRTLTRAARDMKDKEPYFALGAGIAALRWLIADYGYDITGLDVLDPCRFALEAATNIGCLQGTKDRIREMVAADKSIDHFARPE